MQNPTPPPYLGPFGSSGPGQYRLIPQVPLDPWGRPLASWWKRVVAYLIDSVILGIPLGIIGFLLVLAGVHQTCTSISIGGGTPISTSCTTSGLPMGRMIIFWFIALLVTLTYFGVTDGSNRGQTLGKRAVNISTRDVSNGGPIGTFRAATRIFIMDILALPFLFFIPWLLDVLWPLWDTKRQCWHDKAVGSLVVDLVGTGTTPAGIAEGASTQGFTGSQPFGFGAQSTSQSSLWFRLRSNLGGLVAGLVVLVVGIVLLIVLVNHEEHKVAKVTSVQVPTITMPHITIPSPGPVGSSTIPSSSPPKVLLGSSLTDDFSSVHELSPSEWTTNSLFLSGMATGGNESFTPTEPNFDKSGLVMSAVTGPDLFTGIRTTKAFVPAFTVVAKVTGDVSSGNPFGLFLVNPTRTEYVDIAGNLNPGNGAYGIRMDTQNGVPGYLGNTVLVGKPQVHETYTLSLKVDSSGTVTAVVKGPSGAVLGSADNIQVGKGPFYVVLAQWEGNPATEGPNQATWSSVVLEHP